jgi:hypothetical protein
MKPTHLFITQQNTLKNLNMLVRIQMSMKEVQKHVKVAEEEVE